MSANNPLATTAAMHELVADVSVGNVDMRQKQLSSHQYEVPTAGLKE